MTTRSLPPKLRLHRYIAMCSDLSRRVAEKAILAGRVVVNGKKVTTLGMTINPKADRICLDKRLLRPSSHLTYIAFYKPPRMLVTKSDPEGRPTIWSALSRWKGRHNAAGRLDFETEGLLLLSDDGDFLQRLTHPKHEIWKVYRVKVVGKPTLVELGALRDGVLLDGRRTLPARVKVHKGHEVHTWLEIGIREGRNRQLKRMCEAMGHAVLKLKRTAIGPIRLGSMKPGDWRFLEPAELTQLNRELEERA